MRGVISSMNGHMRLDRSSSMNIYRPSIVKRLRFVKWSELIAIYKELQFIDMASELIFRDNWILTGSHVVVFVSNASCLT
ncbi:hypothetical protein TNCV_854541 [Trichonephila clavipes]|nr:hypothetical protein TNCV_854541 [Trichonephila clavipes]